MMTHRLALHSTESEGVRLVPAVVVGFLLGAGQLDHAIVASLICFAGLQASAPFGYADWLGVFALAVLGNLIGGLVLVTLLRLLAGAQQGLAGTPQHRRSPRKNTEDSGNTWVVAQTV